jgi:hypothetical protein
VPELVQQDTGENKQHKRHARECRVPAFFKRAAHSDPGEQYKEGQVEPDLNSGDFRDLKGPAHDVSLVE